MRHSILPLTLALCLPATARDIATDSTGLPGDHFSLPGALELLKRNIEMERFEQEINTDSTHVNDLDLDGNGELDFIRVETLRDGDDAVIILKAVVSPTESQDVAVILIERTGEDSAIVQIIGDEDLYPANTILEPVGGTHPVANIWSWRPTAFFFSPRFYAYTSPWQWGNYPGWWKPSLVHPWPVWRSWQDRTGYRLAPKCRMAHAQALHAPRRSRSTTVQQRYQEAHQRYILQQRNSGGEAKPPSR